MARGKLILHDDPDKEGRKRVYIKFSHRGKVVLILTPEKLLPGDVDDEKNSTRTLRVRSGIKRYGNVNERLQKLEFLYASVVEEFRYSPLRSFSVTEMKKLCIRKAWWKDDILLDHESWLHKFNTWSQHRQDKEAADDKTIYNYTSTRNKFLEFLVNKRIDNIALMSITGDLLNEWVKEMIDANRDPSTIKKHISIIRRCCKFYKHPEIHGEWKTSIRLREIKKQGVAFDTDEIEKMYYYVPEQPEVYQPIKDLLFRFIVTGVRWSDQDIHFLKRGNFIPKRNQKNQNLSLIPLSKYLIEILDKPKPVMSVKHFNKYVKKFCEKAGIDSEVIHERIIKGKVHEEIVPKWKKVSSKIGRKSMVSLLTAAGFTNDDIRKIIGNDVEIEAYQATNMKALSQKVQENFGGILK